MRSATTPLVLVVAVCVLACYGATADMSLLFTSAIELPSVLEGSGFTPNASFSEAVSTLLNSALDPQVTITAETYAVNDDVVVVAGGWATGDESSVSATLDSLQTSFSTATSNAAFLVGINQLSVEYAGRQPSNVLASDACGFLEVVNPLSPTACLRNLSVAFLVSSTAVTQPTSLRATLCRMLDTDCGLISYTGSTTATITNTASGTVIAFQQLSFTILAEDRDTALVTLVSYASSASVLSSYNISYINVNDITVYYQGDAPVLTQVGEIGTCVSSYWYLIFLIILVPIILILSQRMYYWGRNSGKRTVAKSEQDIRAGVHFSSAWNGPGMAGMMGGSMMQNSGWYSPQQQQQGGYQFQQQQPQQQMMPQGYGGNQQQQQMMMMMMQQAQAQNQMNQQPMQSPQLAPSQWMQQPQAQWMQQSQQTQLQQPQQQMQWAPQQQQPQWQWHQQS